MRFIGVGSSTYLINTGFIALTNSVFGFKWVKHNHQSFSLPFAIKISFMIVVFEIVIKLVIKPVVDVFNQFGH